MWHFFAELKRRHIYRVAAAYAVVAWLLLQIVNNVTPIMQSPAWVGQSCLLLLALGFPVAMFFAWMRELPPSDAAAPMRATITDWVLIGVLAAVLVSVGYQQLAPSKAKVTAASGVEAARTAAATQTTAISVAVLPFVNLSPDKDQEFFSDGMTEEITTALAKVPDLRVVARTSAFEFKGQNKDLRTIGQALGATHLIEGSVRKAGDRLRISAQLIKADDGTHIWAEDYDRQLGDVFAVQEDIARAITTSLRMPLGLKSGETLVNNRAIDPASYDQYLRAKALIRIRRQGGVTNATDLLEKVIARNPNFAPGWAQLALGYAYIPLYDPAWLSGSPEAHDVVDRSRSKAETAARRAIELDPNWAEAYLPLGLAQSARGKFSNAEEFYSKVLALDPDNSDALHSYSFMLAGLGYLKKALPMRQHLQELEPYSLTFSVTTAEILWLNGQDDAALAIYKAIPDSNQGGYIAAIYAAQGRYSEAADALLEYPAGRSIPALVQEAAPLLRTAPRTTASPQSLPRLGLNLEFVYSYVGASERILEAHEANVEAGYSLGPSNVLLWESAYAGVRKTERFKALVRKAGMVDYWRAKGWPDLCHPTTGDDFECS